MIVTEKKHRQALAVIASLEERLTRLEKRFNELQSKHESLAYAAGYVYLPRWSSSEYAHKNSDKAKRYIADLEEKRGLK